MAMESTGQYWRPIWNLLEDHFNKLLQVNPQHIKSLNGHKTDPKDAHWIADLLEAGKLTEPGKVSSVASDLFGVSEALRRGVLPKICGASREGASQRSSQEHPRSGGQEVQKRRYHEKRLRAVGQCKEIRKTNRAGERSD